MSQATDGAPGAIDDLDFELVSMGPSSTKATATKAPEKANAFDDLMDALSRTMKHEQIAKSLQQAHVAANAPPPTPFDLEWHPVKGCRMRVSKVCDICPAAIASGMPEINNETLMEPIKHRKGKDILVAPMSDLFQTEIDDEQRNRIFAVMKNAPQHRFFILTKNPGYMRRYLQYRANFQQPLPNVWLGVSVEDQASFDQRVYELMQVPASNRWIAFEPLLGPINTASVQLPTYDRYHPWRGIVQAYEYMDESGTRHWASDDAEPLQQLPIPRWIYIAGQHGANAKPPHPAWVKNIIGAAEGITAWFGGFGEYGLTAKPDLNKDDSLLYMNQTGELRGMGVGSKTNFLAKDFEGETSAVFSRTLAPKERMLLDGSALMQRAPNAVALRSGIRTSPFTMTRTGMTRTGMTGSGQLKR